MTNATVRAPKDNSLKRQLYWLASTTLGLGMVLSFAHQLPEYIHATVDYGGALIVPVLGYGWYRFVRQLQHWEASLDSWRKEAADADRAKNEFLANMSHEIRTPLNGVIGMLELFGQMNLNERQQEYVGTIRKSSEQLLMIINDVLDIAKVEAGQLSLEPIPFDIASCTNDVLETFMYQARQKGIELLVRHNPDMPSRVIGDPGRYRQIITNMLGNALKFTEKGYIYVNVDYAGMEGHEGVFLINITDTGIGIPEDKQKAIFERFTQADASTTRKFGGTGLGLAITRELVRLMDGSIDVISTVGVGSTFKIKLLLPLDTTPAPMQAITLPDIRLLAGKTVLVVDDQPINRTILREILSEYGLKVVEACDGAEALDVLSKSAKNFDVAIIDNLLPDTNGLMLGHNIHVASPATKLLLHTSVGQRGDAKRFEEVGFSAYLLKPYVPNELIDLMRVLIGREEEPNPLFNGMLTRHIMRELRDYGRRTEESATPSISGNYGTVLVVEDDPVNQQVMTAILTKMGADPVIASNGEEAVAMVRDATFPLILMDMNMPVMNGPEAAASIRAFEMEEGRLPVPIVALTANAMKEHRDLCLQSGMSDYLTKPVTIEKLKSVLDKWINQNAALISDVSVNQPMPEMDAKSVEVDHNVVVDEAMFDALTGGDAAARQRLLELFMENTSKGLELMGEVDFGSEDWRKTAHRLKGSAASLGMFGLSDLAAQAETAPEGSNKEELMMAMQVAFEDIRTYATRCGV